MFMSIIVFVYDLLYLTLIDWLMRELMCLFVKCIIVVRLADCELTAGSGGRL